VNETRGNIVQADDQVWMAYVDSEVVAVCEAKGWGHQISAHLIDSLHATGHRVLVLACVRVRTL